MLRKKLNSKSCIQFHNASLLIKRPVCLKCDIYQPPTTMYKLLWDNGTGIKMMLGKPEKMKIGRQRCGSYKHQDDG